MVRDVPLLTMKLISHCLTAAKHGNGIRSLFGFGKRVCPLVHSVLYLHSTFSATLYLNIFRGEQAITQLDWPFTPSHNSSDRFSTQISSVLHVVFPRFNLVMARSPGFVSTACNLVALFMLGFPTAPDLKSLTWLQTSNSLAH